MENVLTANIIVYSVRGQASNRMQPTYLTDIVAKWGIELEAARCKLEGTTHMILLTVLHPSLSCRLRTNDWHFRYRRLQHDFFGDTLLAGTKSKRGNKYAKLFFIKFGCLCALTMDKKGDAHEALSLLFQPDRMPPKMIVDGLKEKNLGNFKRKVTEAGCHLRQMEPESPWEMAAKGGICELKRGSGRKMTKMKSPKVIWDDCLEL